MTAVETVRSLPTSSATVPHLKIMHVMEGRVRVETSYTSHTLSPGMSLALAADTWCRIVPRPRVRLWTIYADEEFMRAQMAWFLPAAHRVHTGFHPHEWAGAPLELDQGMQAFSQLEPLWRQLSILRDGSQMPESAAIGRIELLAKWMRLVLPSFLSSKEDRGEPISVRPPVNGYLTDPVCIGHIGRATRILREQMDKPWSVTTLAREVALSRTHLTRLFTQYAGAPPMRFLTEIRLTEFARLIEETDLSVARAARTVGWSDPRVASTWFIRRFGTTPSQFRASPHKHGQSDEFHS